MAVILTHNRRFIYFIFFSMADPSPPFMPALMTQAFKKRVPLQSKHKLLLFQNILSVSLLHHFLLFEHPYLFYSDQTFTLWRQWKVQALLAVKGKRPFTMWPIQWVRPSDWPFVWCPSFFPQDSWWLCVAVAELCVACSLSMKPQCFLGPSVFLYLRSSHLSRHFTPCADPFWI